MDRPSDRHLFQRHAHRLHHLHRQRRRTRPAPAHQRRRVVHLHRPSRVSTDARSGIVNDPNREDDPQYILRLIGQVITVSLETQQIIAALPPLGLPG
jgi:hypothetical protein